MSAPGRLRTRLTDVGRAVLGWVDDVAKARQELAQLRMELRETERLLSDQIRTNGRLLARHSYEASGGAE